MAIGFSRPGPVAIVAGTLFFIIVTIVLVVVARPSPPRTVSSVPTGTIDRARDIECRSRLRILENTLQIHITEYGHPPEHIDQLPEIDPSACFCPVTGRPYIYDAGAGRVSCPGH